MKTDEKVLKKSLASYPACSQTRTRTRTLAVFLAGGVGFGGEPGKKVEEAKGGKQDIRLMERKRERNMCVQGFTYKTGDKFARNDLNMTTLLMCEP